MKRLTLSEIWIYPIKSLGGISIPSSKVLQKGLLFDRRFMLIDERGKFITQRILPQLALFKLSITLSEVIVTHQTHQLKLSLSTNNYIPTPLQVAIWDDIVTAHEVSELHSAWFSERLEMNCKLVFFPEPNPRPVDPSYVDNKHVSLADAYPFMIIGQRSLDDLNTRLKVPVPINRFRPNLVFTGGVPFEEDTWQKFSIGSTQFAAIKSCSRCILTTVNQITGEAGKEPLKTLSTYRTLNKKIYFGQNLIALNGDEIRVGDDITVEGYK